MKLLTIDEENALRNEWKELPPRISWRDYWLTAQHNKTLAGILEVVEGAGLMDVEIEGYCKETPSSLLVGKLVRQTQLNKVKDALKGETGK